jgi:4-amino-4-deoxychorismate lyase
MSPDRPAAEAHPESAWLNGRPASEVSIEERGLHYGDGLFETIACIGGRPRLLARHLARLAAGAERLGIGLDPSQVETEVRTAAAGQARAVIKVLLTRGRALARGYRATGGEIPTRITLRYGWPADHSTQAQGVRVRTSGVCLGENPRLAGLKHLNRLEQVLARSEWNDAQIVDALMFSSSGRLISGTMSNVFLVRDGALLTPRLERCGVAGVMRATVLALAGQLRLTATEAELDARDLAGAGELFLTNALIGIHAVRELDARPLAFGAVTQRLQHALELHLEEEAARG